MAEAAAAQAKVDAMMAAAYQPSEVMVSAAMLDPSQANIDHAQVSLAGPDSIYVSNIMYGGVPYSALLKYSGGTSATVEAVYGPMGKLIPDRHPPRHPAADRGGSGAGGSGSGDRPDADAAQAEAAAAQAEVDAMMAAAYQPSEVMIMLDP